MLRMKTARVMTESHRVSRSMRNVKALLFDLDDSDRASAPIDAPKNRPSDHFPFGLRGSTVSGQHSKLRYPYVYLVLLW
jgi:hypothetical protein